MPESPWQVPDLDGLAAELGAIRMLAGLHPAPPEEELRHVAAGLLSLLPAAGSPKAWAWDLEPAVYFDPTLPFAGVVANPWPDSPATAGRGATPGRPQGTGSLSADLAAAAAGVKPERIADAYRLRIAERNTDLNAFLTVCAPGDMQALPHPQQAHAPLLGACLAVKDIIETEGLRTTGGSAQRERHVPARDAACWSRLRAAGALCLGKTNTHEFAAGTTNENERFGPARNPLDLGRITGGSSGGSAAAVAAGLASAALGSDTGGSIRIPAACCGVVGLKPTYGRVSRAGVFALSWSLDHVGPIARTVRDTALLFAALAGVDPADPSTLRAPAPPSGSGLGLPRADGLRGVRIGVPWSWLEEAGPTAVATGGIGTSPAVRATFERTLDACRALGAAVVPLDLGSADFATAVNRLIALPESAAWHAPHLGSTPERYGQAVRGRLLAGRYVLAEAYLQAQRLRNLLCRRYAAVLALPGGVHLIATPTLPTTAPAIGAPPQEGLALLRFCAPFNVVGWPALTLPCGRTPQGLPIGLQIAAAPFAEAELLSAGATMEAIVSEWG